MSKITKKGAAWRLLVAAGTTALALGAVPGNTAQAASTNKSLSTNFTVVNLSPDIATVAASYYKEAKEAGAGGEAWTADAGNASFKLDGNGGQKIVRQYTDAVLTAGRGGVILSSDKPLGAIVQILVRTPNTAATSGAYSAISTAADTFYVPLVSRQGSSASGKTNSQIIIQNANTTGPANVTVTFSGGFVKNLVVAPGASYYYDLDDEAGLSPNYFGAAVVSAGTGGQIVVVSNFFTGDDGLQSFNAFPSSSVGVKWFAPLFVSRLANGLNSPVAIQNLSGAAMAAGSVTLNCIADAGNPSVTGNFTKTNTAAVAVNAAYYFNPVTDLTLPDNWVGACSVTAPGNVVSFVQLRYVGAAPINSGNAAAHEAINASGTNKKVFVPLVAKRLANGFATAVTIQNLAAAPTTVNLTYKPSSDYIAAGGSSADITVGPFTIAAGGSLIQNHRVPGVGSGNGLHNLPDAWFGTLVVTSNDGAIDGFVQLTNFNNPTPAGDTFMAHNVFTQPKLKSIFDE